MARFEFCAATFREGGGVNRAVVCHHTSNASLRRRSFLSEFRPQFSPVLFKRKSHFFNSTNLRTRSRICPPVRAEYTDRPFKVEDYKRVRINTVTMVSQNPASGIMLLIEDKYGEEVEDPDPRGLMIQVGGDTLLGIAYKAADKEPERPMSLQLLNNVLERFETLNPNEWHLLHVAVVDIIDNTFIGRLYFGDPETDEIVWDCDCRPSDACWLALAHECRIYIHRSVWNNYAESLKKIYLEDSDVRASLEKSILKPESTIKSTSELDPFTSVMESDPSIIKRMKREMSLAVTEEDYSTAARIRDHPYMKKYKSIVELRKIGRFNEASQIEQDLREQISQDNFDD